VWISLRRNIKTLIFTAIFKGNCPYHRKNVPCRELAGDYGIALHAHRAMHTAFARYKYHGISMFVLAKLYRVIGVDQLHIGTAGAGKMEGEKWEVIQYKRIITEDHYVPDENDVFHLEQKSIVVNMELKK